MSERPCCLYCHETKFSNRAEAQASLMGIKQEDSNRIKNENSKCHRLGPITRNPFFNFLRHLRDTTCSLSIIKMAKEAGAEWRKMSAHDKSAYVIAAGKAPKTVRKRRKMNKITKRVPQTLAKRYKKRVKKSSPNKK